MNELYYFPPESEQDSIYTTFIVQRTGLFLFLLIMRVSPHATLTYISACDVVWIRNEWF